MSHEKFMRERRKVRRDLPKEAMAVQPARKSPPPVPVRPVIVPNAKSSRPILTFDEHTTQVLLSKSGKLKKKSLKAQFKDRWASAASTRRNNILADPFRLALSRHPRWLGTLTSTPAPAHIPAPPLRKAHSRTRAIPLAVRLPRLRHAACHACLTRLTPTTVPVPANFVPRFKHEANYIEPVHGVDLIPEVNIAPIHEAPTPTVSDSLPESNAFTLWSDGSPWLSRIALRCGYWQVQELTEYGAKGAVKATIPTVRQPRRRR